MTRPASSGHALPNKTPRKRTCEPWAVGCGATDVRWPITPIRTAFFVRLAGPISGHNCRGKEPARSWDGPCRNWGSNGSPRTVRRPRVALSGCLRLLQDRLVKEMRLAGIATIEAANHFLEVRFLPEWEQRFTVAPRNARNAHRRLGRDHRLEEILSVRAALQEEAPCEQGIVQLRQPAGKG